MHILGKVFLGLAILFGLIDAVLASMLLANRTHWQKRIEDKKKQYTETVHPQLLAKQQQHLALQQELGRLQTTWGQSWSAPGQVLNAQNAAIAVGAGTAAGLPDVSVGPAKNMFLFVEDPQGTSRYVGEFRLLQSQADQSGFALARNYQYPDEGAGWQLPAGAWRIRQLVPSSWPQSFTELDTQYSLAMQGLDHQQNLLRIQTEQLAASQAVLDQRLAELNGDPQPPEGASQDVIDGVVLTIRNEETLRNADLQLLDALRHDYKRKVDTLNKLLAANQTAVDQLPGAQAATTRPASAVPVSTASGAR
jgi:hypothetical protein